MGAGPIKRDTLCDVELGSIVVEHLDCCWGFGFDCTCKVSVKICQGTLVH